VNWRGLLVSVRDATEAAEALEGDAAIIDVKEPGRGPLGPADPETVATIAGVVGGRRPWTMACGELGDGNGVGCGGRGRSAPDRAVAAIRDHIARVCGLLGESVAPPAAVKVGLAGAVATDWRRRLAAAFAGLPAGSDRVAVAYADWRRAEAPAPPEVVAAAAALGCAAVLIDTYDKSAEGLFGCCPPGLAAAWVRAAREAGLRVALAGRIAAEEIPSAWALGPDVVAVRSAVCFNGRTGRVQAGLVRRAVSLGERPVGTAAD